MTTGEDRNNNRFKNW